MSRYHFSLHGNLQEGWSLEAFHVAENVPVEHLCTISYVWSEPKLFDEFEDAVELMEEMLHEEESI